MSDDVVFKPHNRNIHSPDEFNDIAPAFPIAITCPHCGNKGTFQGIANVSDAGYSKKGKWYKNGGYLNEGTVKYVTGIRRCPNLECNGFITFVGYRKSLGVDPLWFAPSLLIDFNSSRIPENMRETMVEAISCHGAGAYRASAIMVRRALELLCEDKGASGNNLKDRISKLSQHATVSPSLLAAADHLRLLGNDAAHIEAKTYDDISEAHASLAIEVAKELLKAVYQHDDLISRLEALRRT
ncbi:DUF4145 domain-containing protein [Methylorubrum podarium]|uniref:DUF4145 domain-containing protein n=1 Tax=Methylorubrum podarium TaxID=200476 RepID=A0ABV1QJF9_9HYPH